MSSIFPDSIKHIAIIAPAGAIPFDSVKENITLLEKDGITVTVMPHVFTGAKEPYLSASIEHRIADLEMCWHDETIDLILPLRGGYGSAQLLPHINWKLLKTRDVPILGFSDITALHLGMIKNGVGRPIAASTLSLLKKTLNSPASKKSLKNNIFSDYLTIPTQELTIIKNGETHAPLYPVNLTVLSTLIGTPYLPDLTNTILLIEDIGEAPYAIDRYLNQLLQTKILPRLSGLIFGQFTNTGRPDTHDIDFIFKKYSQFINGPVVANFHFGHTFPIETIPYGILTHLKT